MAIPAFNEDMKKLMHQLLQLLVHKKGSDLFVTAGFPPAMKLDGQLAPVSEKKAFRRAHGDDGARDYGRQTGQRV